MASLATPQSEKASIAAFRTDVIDASMDALVLVDFWAEWCGPCKTLGPLIERVVASYAPRVKLVKIDVDKNPTIAGQFRVQSIPTVYAFLGGQPVDGFAGAVGERELKAFIDRLLAGAPAPGGDEEAEIAALVEAANTALAERRNEEAAEIFGSLLREFPERHDLAGGYARALLALGQIDGAEAALQTVPADSKEAGVAQARAALALAREAGNAGDAAALAAAVAAAPDDHAKRFELAGGLLARGDRDGAAEALLEIIRRDRGWNEGAARERFLKLLESAGLDDKWALAQRRKLSTILFS
jgi:putative thioredoxin